MIDSTIAGQLDGVKNYREWLNLETSKKLIEGKGADTGGPNALPHGKMTWTPATAPGQAATFTFTGAVRKPGQVWDNTYAYNELAASPLKAIYFGLQMDIAFPAATLANKRPFETEMEYCESGIAYNMAWRIGPDGWEMFNAKLQSWESFPALPKTKLQPGKFVSMWAHFQIDREARTCTHDSLKVDNDFHYIGIVRPAVPKWPANVNYFHQAIQEDSDGRGTPLVALLKNVNVRCL